MYKSNINLNLYKNFYEVAKYGSISKAAEYGYTSQPAVSKAIKKLESELGVQLFIRSLNGVELTEKGQELLYFVEKSYGNLITAERMMKETENLERGKLSIGMPSNVGSFFLFDKIIAFHKKYPNIEITIITGSTANLINLLDSHKVDFVIDTSPINVKLTKGMKVKLLKEVSYAFVIKKDTKKIDYKKIKELKDLKDKSLILPIPNTANRNDLDELLRKKRIEIENVLNIHTSEMIISAVKKDLGIGYVIYDLVKDDINNGILDEIKLKESLPTVGINIVYDKEFLSKAPRKFIEDYIDHEIKL